MWWNKTHDIYGRNFSINLRFIFLFNLQIICSFKESPQLTVIKAHEIKFQHIWNCILA